MNASLHPATLMPFLRIPLAPLLAPVDPDLLEMEDFAEVFYIFLCDYDWLMGIFGTISVKF